MWGISLNDIKNHNEELNRILKDKVWKTINFLIKNIMMIKDLVSVNSIVFIINLYTTVAYLKITQGQIIN